MGRVVWFTLGGIAVGILLIHPVAMLAYTMKHYQAPGPINLTSWLHIMRLAFGPGVVHMGLLFALLGGASGFILGSWFVQKKRLLAETIESQRNLAALETLRELMVTLAHYIRNANMVVGGFSGRVLKQCPDPELQEEVHLIHEASQEIDAVINSLQNLTEISTVEYTESSHELIIDLKKNLEARLAKTLQSKDQKQG